MIRLESLRRDPLPLVILASAAVVYALGWNIVTGDMRITLVSWFDTIVVRGQIAAFSEPFSNYTPPYLYLLALTTLLGGLISKVTLIKLLSVAGTLVLAGAVSYLLKCAGAERDRPSALWLLLLPSIILNAPVLGQCDAMWSAACVMTLAEAVRGRPRLVLVWSGVALAFKAQSIFFAPFVVARLISTRTPLPFWHIPMGVFAALMAPAWLMGWPAYDLATIYLHQAEWNPDFLGNAPNLWAVAQLFLPEAALGFRPGGLLISGVAALAYIAVLARKHLPPRQMVAAALLSALLLPYLLPKMHERFFFLADVLSFALALIARDRRTAAIAVLVQAASVLAITGWMFGFDAGSAIGAIPLTIALWLMAAELMPHLRMSRLPRPSAGAALPVR